MDKDNLIKSKQIQNIEEILVILDTNLHLSFSSLKEILDFLEELENVKKINALDFVEKYKFKAEKFKKENAKIFIEYIRQTRNPLMYEAFNKLKNNLSSFKGTGIKTEYPKNLEGDSINISMEIKSDSDVDKLIRSLEKNREKLKQAINIVKKGG